MSADFMSLAIPCDQADIAALLQRLAAAETEYNGNVYCDIDPMDLLHLAGGDFPVGLSPNFPVFVALDRFLARAAGVTLLDGHAFRWVQPGEVGAVSAAAGALRGVDPSPVIERLERFGNGADDVRSGLDALEQGAARALSEGGGLLLVCLPC